MTREQHIPSSGLRTAGSSKAGGRMAFPFAASLAATALALAASTGCHDSSGSTASRAGADTGPTLDARGGWTDSEVFLRIRTPFEGNAGAGGTVKILSISGDVEIYRRRRTVNPPAQTLTGVGGLTVGSGESVSVKGTQVLSFLFIRAGGELILENNTTFLVTGDVHIGGNIRSVTGASGRVIDGPDLTIIANGTVLVAGKIDCSGHRSDDSEGGDGGDVTIVAGVGTDTTDTVRIYMTGAIDTSGGSSRSQDINASVAGSGGDIEIGTVGLIQFSGRLNARAGSSFTNNATSGPRGGDIRMIAGGNILCEEMREINAGGGDSSGTPGDGGSITIEAANGDVTIDGFEIQSLGGDSTFQSDSAGDGGTVAINGVTLTVNDCNIRVRGGDSEEEVLSIGGLGGTVSMTASTLIDADNQVRLTLRGGSSGDTTADGGAGGTFVGAPMDPTGIFSFDGTVNVRGGKTFSLKEGPRGDYCIFNADNTTTVANVTGINEFPVGTCSVDDITALSDISSELDNIDTTIRPVTGAGQLDVVGPRIFRIYPDTTIDLDITVTGDAGADLDIYVVDGDVLATVQSGALPLNDLDNAGVYFAASETTAGGGVANSEALTVVSGSLGGLLSPEGYLLLVIFERAGIAEQFTISLE